MTPGFGETVSNKYLYINYLSMSNTPLDCGWTVGQMSTSLTGVQPHVGQRKLLNLCVLESVV